MSELSVCVGMPGAHIKLAVPLFISIVCEYIMSTNKGHLNLDGALSEPYQIIQLIDDINDSCHQSVSQIRLKHIVEQMTVPPCFHHLATRLPLGHHGFR